MVILEFYSRHSSFPLTSIFNVLYDHFLLLSTIIVITFQEVRSNQFRNILVFLNDPYFCIVNQVADSLAIVSYYHILLSLLLRI